jgi:hypothetical protein
MTLPFRGFLNMQEVRRHIANEVMGGGFGVSVVFRKINVIIQNSKLSAIPMTPSIFFIQLDNNPRY